MAKSPSEQIRELAADIRVAQERDEQRRREVERVVAKVDVLQTEIATLRQENAVLRQQLQDHIKHIELWSNRGWALIILLVSTVFSLASGLIITLARK